MKTDLLQSCGHCWVFQICWHIECSTFMASSFRIWNSSTGIPSPPHHCLISKRFQETQNSLTVIPFMIQFSWVQSLSHVRHHSSKASILQRSAFFTVQLSHPYMTTGKTIAWTWQTFVSQVMSPLVKMLSRLVITFLPRSKRLLISWLQSPSAMILEPQKTVWHCFHCFPIYFPWSDWTRCHDLRFMNVEL